MYKMKEETKERLKLAGLMTFVVVVMFLAAGLVSYITRLL